MNVSKKITWLILFFLAFKNLHCQDLKAGEITVSHLTGYTYQAMVTFYYEASTFASRPYLTLNWGDGVSDTIIGGPDGCGDANTLTRTFDKAHTYSGPGNYTISCLDSFRINNVTNILNSDLEKLSLRYDLVINTFFPPNNSPVSLNCLVDEFTGSGWQYNPGAFDVDGDSLYYSVVSPFDLTNYTFPVCTIAGSIGDFALSPTSTGAYSVCMKIEEWKLLPSSSSYYSFGSTYRNMLVYVNSLATTNLMALSDDLHFYPNPVTMELFLELKSDAPIRIIDVLGKIHYNEKICDGKNIIDLSGYTPGLYFITFLSGNQSVTKKFIKE